ncbi:MAG: hypothetical protein LBK67_08965 [Coriobacteriales bacterium]|jgi:TM2 domain-containing membrane protein YozV|nr:hypothetical protein [Coriobacteriales bacterium]
MVLILGCLAILLSVAMTIIALVLGYAPLDKMIFAIAAVCLVVVAVCCVRFKTKRLIAYLGFVASLLLAGYGVFVLVSKGMGIGTIVLALLNCIIFILMLPFMVSVKSAKFFNRSGGELCEVTSIKGKDGSILVKAILLGSMPETIYAHPVELRKMLSLLDVSAVTALPGVLLGGFNVKKDRD